MDLNHLQENTHLFTQSIVLTQTYVSIITSQMKWSKMTISLKEKSIKCIGKVKSQHECGKSSFAIKSEECYLRDYSCITGFTKRQFEDQMIINASKSQNPDSWMNLDWDLQIIQLSLVVIWIILNFVPVHKSTFTNCNLIHQRISICSVQEKTDTQLPCRLKILFGINFRDLLEPDTYLPR